MDVAQKAMTLFSPRRAVLAAVTLLCALLLTSGTTSAAAPMRIVSIVPAVTEMLFAIGAGPQVVGVSSFDHFPADVDTRARVGGLLDPNVERIFALKPDLVIVYGAKSDLAARLSRANIATYAYETGGLANVTGTIRALGDRLGGVRLDRASELGGVTPELVAEVRAALDGAGATSAKIVISGGLTVERIAQFKAAGSAVDTYAVGSAISGVRPIDFTADLHEIDGAPIGKRGRASGLTESPRLREVDLAAWREAMLKG